MGRRVRKLYSTDFLFGRNLTNVLPGEIRLAVPSSGDPCVNSRSERVRVRRMSSLQWKLNISNTVARTFRDNFVESLAIEEAAETKTDSEV